MFTSYDHPEEAAERMPETLVDILRRRATEKPSHLAYTFLADGEFEEANITYAGLDKRARAIGASLSTIATSGERALLVYPMGLEFISSFFGCLYGGVTAVPAYSPDPDSLQRTLRRLIPIIRDARPLVALTTSSSLRLIEKVTHDHQELSSMHWITTEA